MEEADAMRLAFRLVATIVALALLSTGPLAPAAHAQQPAPAPDLFQETLKASQMGERDRSRYEAAATATNMFYVPGKAILCMFGAFGGFSVLILTFGSGYRAASGIVHEGCGGKWAVKAEDLQPRPPTIDFGN
jgi:hypothetical protein